jgi:hypothetical protein
MSTRAFLSVLLCGTTLAVGLWTCIVETRNHARAQELAEQQRAWEMIAAANAQMAAIAAAHVAGVPNRELDVTRRPTRGEDGE